MSRRYRRPSRRAVLAAVFCAALAGCTAGQKWNPFTETAAALPLDPTKEQVIAHLNRNIEPCTGWRCHEVKVRTAGIPLSLGATVAVESPRKFRMIVSAINGDQADFGSNDERMWFWVRQMEPKVVLTCAHEELPAAQQRMAERGMAIPFRPDWLMEVCGVIPLSGEAYEMHDTPGDAGTKQLVAQQQAPGGAPVVRVLTVDLKRGVITSHALRDGDGRLLAEAKLGDFRRDAKTGVTLPHKIHLAWPDAQGDMSLSLGDIDVNPVGIPETVWQPCRIPDCPTFDLGQGRIVTLDQAVPASAP